MIESLLLTLQTATVVAVIALVLSLPLARLLSATHHLTWPMHLLALLPLAVPPTAYGMLLLTIFVPDSVIGRMWITVTGDTFAFTWAGVVFACILTSIPFALYPLWFGLRRIDWKAIRHMVSLGITPRHKWQKLILPQMLVPLTMAFLLSFLHTLGEFGAVMIIGGSIPNETQLLSVLLYQQVEILDLDAAETTLWTLLTISLLTTALIVGLQAKFAESLD